jgi:hypothetical protein
MVQPCILQQCLPLGCIGCSAVVKDDVYCMHQYCVL